MPKAKETTARNPSVGADGGQSSKTHTLIVAEPEEEFNENFVETQEFFRKLQRAQDPDFLNTVSYNELMEETLPSRRAVIDGLLGTGVYLLAGAPKIGKSFLVAQIAYRVSTGTELWGYRVHGGTVLYLALEDDKKRLQERMARMFGVEGCDNLHFATHAGQVGQNLDKQLKNFLTEHPDSVLVIVDTLQKVREMTTEGYSYASDYDVITSLHPAGSSHPEAACRGQLRDDFRHHRPFGRFGWGHADEEGKPHRSHSHSGTGEPGSAGTETVHNQESGESGLGTGPRRDGALEGTAGPNFGGGGKAGHGSGSLLGGHPHRTGNRPGASGPEQSAHPTSERKGGTAAGGIRHRL